MPNNINGLAASIKKHTRIIAPYLLMVFLLENCNLLNERVQPRTEKEVIPTAVEKVQAFVQVAATNAEGAIGKDIVLVLGNTGAGKSTIINYALGSEMEKEWNDSKGKDLARPKNTSKHWAEIGNGVKSQTLLPNVYTTAHSNVIYCDCPGFHDTRTQEDRLNITIATQLMVNSAKSIKGVVVIIDPNDLESNAINMRSLSLTLSQLLQGKVNPNSILFVFNKKDSSKRMLRHILNNLGEVRESEESKLKQLTTNAPRGTEYETVQQVVSLLQLINQENSLLIDIFDNFESKNQLEKLLQNIAATPKEGFNFSGYDTTRVEFERQVAEIVRNMTSKLIEFSQASESISVNKELIPSCVSRISSYQTLIKQLEATVLADATSTEKEVKKLEEQMEIQKRELKELEIRKQELQKQIIILTAQKLNVDTDEEVLHWQDSGNSPVTGYWDEMRNGWWIFGSEYYFGCYHQKKYFQYNGPPFSRISKSIEKGKIVDEIMNKEQGVYQGTFTGNEYAEEGHATVLIYGKKKDLPEHKKRIQQMELEIQELQEKVKKHDQEMQELYRTCESTQQMIESHKNNAEKQKAEKTKSINKAKEEIERAKREQKDLESISKLLGKQLDETQAYIEHQESLIKAISSFVAQGICKESSLFESFKEHYKLYQNLRKGLVLETEVPRHLECPITLGIFHDPVLTTCGHTFSSAPLLEHLAKQKFCPTCKKSVAFEDIIPNIIVREQVEEFRAKRAAAAKKKLEEATKRD